MENRINPTGIYFYTFLFHDVYEERKKKVDNHIVQINYVVDDDSEYVYILLKP